uniref:Uncharacterized protein n=1 Tax=Timema shepardi TaxID=629360 RepID=A0A7R9AKW0_TIMSH|nr:unnamed protein product [Timema shepardi]
MMEPYENQSPHPDNRLWYTKPGFKPRPSSHRQTKPDDTDAFVRMLIALNERWTPDAFIRIGYPLTQWIKKKEQQRACLPSSHCREPALPNVYLRVPQCRGVGKGWEGLPPLLREVQKRDQMENTPEDLPSSNQTQHRWKTIVGSWKEYDSIAGCCYVAYHTAPPGGYMTVVRARGANSLAYNPLGTPSIPYAPNTTTLRINRMENSINEILTKDDDMGIDKFWKLSMYSIPYVLYLDTRRIVQMSFQVLGDNILPHLQTIAGHFTSRATDLSKDSSCAEIVSKKMLDATRTRLLDSTEISLLDSTGISLLARARIRLLDAIRTKLLDATCSSSFVVGCWIRSIANSSKLMRLKNFTMNVSKKAPDTNVQYKDYIRFIQSTNQSEAHNLRTVVVKGKYISSKGPTSVVALQGTSLLGLYSSFSRDVVS